MKLKEKLRQYAMGIVDRRLECLQNRRAFFPWLRARCLMKKFSLIERFLGKDEQ